MPQSIQVGTILIDEIPPLSQVILLGTESFSEGWRIVNPAILSLLIAISMLPDLTSFSWRQKQK